MPRKILCVSFDQTVGHDRCEALTHAGYEVTGALGVERAFRCLDAVKFDLVIVGHRFHRLDKQALISEARQRWHTPVLLVCGSSTEPGLFADGRASVFDGLAGLLAAVAKVLPSKAAA